MIKITCLASGSSGNLYIVENEKTKLLLECGFKYNDLKLKLGFKHLLGGFDGCVITHAHHDHYGCFKDVNKYMPIYSTKELYQKKTFKGVMVNENDSYKIKTIRFKPIPVFHGKTECYAYIFKDNDSTILFATDFSKFEKGVDNFAFTEIYIEINYNNYIIKDIIDNIDNNNDLSDEEKTQKRLKYERQISTHMSLENSIQILSRMNLSKCKKINAIHLSNECSNEEIIKKQIKEKFGIECQTWKGETK